MIYDKAAQQGSPGLTHSKLACRLHASLLANWWAFSSTGSSLPTCGRRLALDNEMFPSVTLNGEAACTGLSDLHSKTARARPLASFCAFSSTRFSPPTCSRHPQMKCSLCLILAVRCNHKMTRQHCRASLREHTQSDSWILLRITGRLMQGQLDSACLLQLCSGWH